VIKPIAIGPTGIAEVQRIRAALHDLAIPELKVRTALVLGDAFLWTWETGIEDLGTLPGDVFSAGFWINNRGDAIGASVGAPGPPMGNFRPFLWTNGKMLDLMTLVPANSPLQLLNASSINDRGEITGFGLTSNGEVHAYLLTPAGPSPSATTGPTGTTAIVTPLNLTTSDSSVMLDGSGSTSAVGALQYLYTVVQGGKQAAILQIATDPKATIDFVEGPGLYLIQLTVTDASGNAAKSPVVMLNYQPSGTN
jgi:hypothetical protein